MFDFLVIGSGLFGSVFSREVAEHGKTVLVVEKNRHIGGMCYSEKIEGIEVHKYGPHLFHTNDRNIWNYVNRFSEFNSFQQRTKISYCGKIYSFPINLMTLHELWGVTTPLQAINKLNSVKHHIANPKNLEEWILSQVGEEIYNIFIKGYTEKQWGKDPKDLPSFIIQRLPIRLTYDDRYFSDQFQGVPKAGYTNLIENILDHKNIKIELNVNFFENKFNAKNIVYTGKLDEFFNYKFGELEYRSLKFETKILDGDFQGTSIINFTDKNIPYTRIVEHKHFTFLQSNKTVITEEYPVSDNKLPFYPILDDKNKSLYNQYLEETNKTNVIFGGRLGTFKYYDMHQVIAQAIHKAQEFLKGSSVK